MEPESEAQTRKRGRQRDAVVPRRKREVEVPPTSAEEERRARENVEALSAWARSTAEDQNKAPPDVLALEASEFRESWTRLWSDQFGAFEDTTKIPPMRFTRSPAPPYTAFAAETLQIFSVKVTSVKGGLQWPLHVFGTVALRDAVDRRRNVIFNRERDNCQILRHEHPCLQLTGPTRAVVMFCQVVFEVDLKVKGTTEHEDQDLSYLAVPLMHSAPLKSCLLINDYTSKLTTVELKHGQLCYSVEATISVQVTNGSWHGYRSEFFACTTSIGEEVLLLDSGDKEVPVSSNGKIELSRQVVSVERKGKLNVFVKVWSGDKFLDMKIKGFTPKEAGRSHGKLNVGFCKMEVIVAWSLVTVSYNPSCPL